MITKTYLKTLKQTEVAALLGKTERRIQQLHDEGLPRNGTGRGATYDWESVRGWQESRISGSKPGAEGPQGNKARRETAEADLAEMERDRIAENTLDRSESVAAWRNSLVVLRTNLLGLPARILERIDGVKEYRERLALADGEVRSSLRDIVAEIEGIEE